MKGLLMPTSPASAPLNPIKRLSAACVALGEALASPNEHSEELLDEAHALVQFVSTERERALPDLLEGAGMTTVEAAARAEQLLESFRKVRPSVAADVLSGLDSSTGPVPSGAAGVTGLVDVRPQEAVLATSEPEIVPAFPWDYWEPWEQDLCSQIGNSLGVSPVAPAVHALGVKAAASQATCTISGHNQLPLFTSIYLFEAGRTTSSKTAVRTLLDRPLHDLDRELRRSAPAAQSEMFARMQLARRDALAATQRVQRLSAADREGSMAELTASWDAARRAHAGVEMTPRMTTGNATWSMVKIMLAQTGRLYLSSGEGRSVMRLIPNSEELCDVYSHTRLDDDRTTRRTVPVESPALTISLSVQFGVLADILRNKDDEDIGVFGRFLFHQAEPVSAGRSRVDDSLLERFYWRVRQIAGQPLQSDRLNSSVTFTLGTSSLERYYRCRDDGYRREAEGDLQRPSGWGRRMGENMLRLSGGLHVWRYPDLATAPRVISDETVDVGVRLMEYFASHTRDVFRDAQTSPGTLAQQILFWISGQPKAISAGVFRLRDMMSDRFKLDKAELLPALEQLVAGGWLEALPVVNQSHRFRVLRAPTRHRE